MEDECFLKTHYLSHGMQRRVIFERSECGDWILKWVWIHDTSAPGYLLVSEYISLGADAWFQSSWPFVSVENYYRDQNLEHLRFGRRLADKARKERARTGQKRAKSRMPGSWNW
jgi:hypothetical protein